MTAEEERIFDQKVEQEFRGQRELPNGRNFLWDTSRYHTGATRKAYDIGICRTFPTAPGSYMCGACEHEDCELRRDE